MADVIIVDLEYVSALQSDVDTTRETLRGEGGSGARLTTCGAANGALDDFMGKWDERRGELADTLDAVSQMLGSIHESFARTQDELIAGLKRA